MLLLPAALPESFATVPKYVPNPLHFTSFSLKIGPAYLISTRSITEWFVGLCLWETGIVSGCWVVLTLLYTGEGLLFISSPRSLAGETHPDGVIQSVRIVWSYIFLSLFAIHIFLDFRNIRFIIIFALFYCFVVIIYILFASLLNWKWQLSFLFVLVTWISMTNQDPFKLRYPGLDRYYEHPSPLLAINDPPREPIRGAGTEDKVAPDGKSSPRINDQQALENWASRLRSGGRPKPKLIVVATSGGALRAAYWTKFVLSQLASLIPDFRDHVRIVTGASGGMVGASYYVVAGMPGAEQSGLATSLLPSDSLSPVLKQLLFRDVLWIFNPVGRQRYDRGISLEDSWTPLRIPFASLAPLEWRGELPSMIFSPMVIETKGQLLISNLDLGYMTRDPLTRKVSFSIEFFKLFPDANEFSLATAVRMNAAFPLISPANNLPTSPPLRVVDAGYYDNHGILVASSWIINNSEWLRENTSGVALIWIRAFPFDTTPSFEEHAAMGSGLVNSFQFITSPLTAYFASTEVIAKRYLEDKIGATASLFKDAKGPGGMSFFSVFEFDNSTDVSMNWFITDDEIFKIEDKGLLSRYSDRFVQWWHAGP